MTYTASIQPYNNVKSKLVNALNNAVAESGIEVFRNSSSPSVKRIVSAKKTARHLKKNFIMASSLSDEVSSRCLN